MHQALYRKYRPATFDRVCGQGHITDVLSYQVKAGRCSHAYLFCGSRGTGKTSSAKILAKAVNCESPKNGSPCLCCRSCLDIDAGLATDVIELDAASNNGVDDIRDICDKASYIPAVLKKKVYIIDEVHMLSQSAFNALLKTIEEPPEHVIFILATTEFHKVPATIVSRCQRFDFRRIDMRIIADNLLFIAKSEGMVLEEEAALLLARQAEGVMRDAIGLFELCSAGGADVTAAKVSEVLGLSGYDRALETIAAVARGDMAHLFEVIADISASSKDISVFWKELISVTRDMLVSKYSENAKAYLDLTDQEAERLFETARGFTLNQLIYYCNVLDEAAARMVRSPQTKRTTAEFALLRMSRPELDTSNDALAARLAALEDKMALGVGQPPAPGAAQAPAPVAAPTPVSAPAPATEAKAAPAPSMPEASKAAAPPAPAPEKNEGQSGEYDRVRDISEAVGRLDGQNRGLASFLMSAEAYVSRDGKKLLLRMEAFAAMMFKSDDAKRAVAGAFALAKITDGVAEVTVETVKAGEKKKSAADDLSGWM
ncbi:MAG: DNA polymerase III subunit gamma/tau [Clostridia bacterium]|nr:DNA polymerase III subunit gamma/tau [Clostridia bacterium]